jgi:hypothetical protein
MEKAKKFDDTESLTVPANQVLAIIMDSDEATDVVQTLNQNGFSSDEIGVLAGTVDAGKLDAAAGKQGFLSRLFAAGVEIGDRDTDYLKQYRRALLNGRTVVLSPRMMSRATRPENYLKRAGLGLLPISGNA